MQDKKEKLHFDIRAAEKFGNEAFSYWKKLKKLCWFYIKVAVFLMLWGVVLQWKEGNGFITSSTDRLLNFLENAVGIPQLLTIFLWPVSWVFKTWPTYYHTRLEQVFYISLTSYGFGVFTF